MALRSGFRCKQIVSPLAVFSIILSCAVGYAETSIEGFRDLKFGMTQQEVSALPACRGATECLYELTDKNRYITLTYVPETVPGNAEPAGNASIPKLAKITIDMGHYTDEWYQQLQAILGNSYRLTHDFTETSMQSFLAKEQDELKKGYADGQVLLKVMRRPFGNITVKVIYQNATLAEDFIQHRHPTATSAN